MIDVNKKLTDSRWKDIYNHLKEKGVDVYSPGQKTGECTKPYVVIKSAGRSGLTEISSSQDLYDIMCYVPETKYSTLDPFVDLIEEYLDELFPMIRPVHFRTSSFLDDQVKAHMISTQYLGYRKNTRR